MHGQHLTHINDPGPAKVPAALNIGSLLVGIIGLAVFVAAVFTGSEAVRQQAWMGFLVSYLFFFFLAMGAAAFLAVNYVVNAKWYVAAKRPLEAIASFAYLGGFLFPLVALAGTTELYPWAMEGATYPYEGTLKDAWLSPGFHAVKLCVYVFLLSGLTWLLVRNSTRADHSPDPNFHQRQVRIAIIFLLVFAPVFSLFSMDVVMSLAPKWFSTMFGVYCFAGAFVSAMALMMLLSFWLKRRTPHLHERQLYDIGTYVMSFATFMMYIGFSQFMLIWYANLPEETSYFLVRYEGGWIYLTGALPVLKWVIPFLLLMPPPLRTNLGAQTICCVSILVGQLADIYWMVAPVFEFGEAGAAYWPNLVNIATFVGMLGIFGWSLTTFLSRHSMLPVGDPDLLNSVNGEYLHA